MTRVEVVATHIDGRRVRTVIRPATEAGTYHEYQETPAMPAIPNAPVDRLDADDVARLVYRNRHRLGARIGALIADGHDPSVTEIREAVTEALTPAPRDPRARAIEEILVDQLAGDVPAATLERLADAIAHEIPS